MKLAATQLASHLQKQLASIYLVTGDETLLVQEQVDMIRAAARKAGFNERQLITPESNQDWGQLIHSQAHSLSLFAEKRLLELNLSQAKLSSANTKILQEYAAAPAADTLLIIYTTKLDSKTEKTAWYKALDQGSIIIPVWPITQEQLPAWIMQRAQRLQLTLAPAAAAFLAEQIEGNLLAAAQELEKLRLLQTDGIIDQAMLEQAVADNARYDIFTLVDSALAGKTARALKILTHLAEEDIEPTLVLWAITRELRTQVAIMQQKQQGAPLSSLMAKFRIWEKRQACVRAFLQRSSLSQCWQMLLTAASIDRLIKGAEKGNTWHALANLILAMA